MINMLLLILFLLLLIIGREQGLKTFLCFCFNFALIVSYIVLIVFGCNAILASIITCVCTSLLSLFFLNGVNIKTISAFKAFCVVLIFIFILIYAIGSQANLQGFSRESLETISLFRVDINYNMTHLFIGLILVCTSGTMIDTAIAISTSINELYRNNTNLSAMALFKSGMNVGRDILSTTINTLFFLFIGGMIGFFVWHKYDSFGTIINYKSFIQESTELICCCIGSILIIPVCAYITSMDLRRKK